MHMQYDAQAGDLKRQLAIPSSPVHGEHDNLACRPAKDGELSSLRDITPLAAGIPPALLLRQLQKAAWTRSFKASAKPVEPRG